MLQKLFPANSLGYRRLNFRLVNFLVERSFREEKRRISAFARGKCGEHRAILVRTFCFKARKDSRSVGRALTPGAIAFDLSAQGNHPQKFLIVSAPIQARPAGGPFDGLCVPQLE
jgi:hypothetical protein